MCQIALNVHSKVIQKISTKALNDALHKILLRYPPQSDQGKQIQIKYITQVSTQPTIFALYVSNPKKIKTL